MTNHDATANAPIDHDDESTDTSGMAKNKLVRDSFTIPKAEYANLNELKQRATRLTQPAKKSEILRAGIELLKGLSDPAFLAALAAVPNLKTGRPPKDGETDGESAVKVGRHVRDKTVPRPAATGGAKAANKPARAAKPAKPTKPTKPAKPAKPARAAKADKVVDPVKKAARVAAKANKAKA